MPLVRSPNFTLTVNDDQNTGTFVYREINGNQYENVDLSESRNYDRKEIVEMTIVEIDDD